MKALSFLSVLTLCTLGFSLTSSAADQSIARVWMERALAAIRVDTPHPPAQARNYLSFSICMYDAWAAYDPVAVGYVYRGKHTAADIASARSNAISYAVYRMMKERHAFSRTAQATLAADDLLMVSLGYNISDQSRDPSTPTGVGNRIYDVVSLFFSNDGSRQTNGTPYPQANPPVAYPDYPSGHPRRYNFSNLALATDRPGITDGFGNSIVDVNHWQRLLVVNAVDQNGFPAGSLQNYLGAQWLWVRPFSLTRMDENKPWIDPGPPPFWSNSVSHAQFVKEIVANITADSHLTPDDGVMIDISPGVHGNNSLDFAGSYGNGEFDMYDGHGYGNNPVTGQPYAPNLVKRGDYARVLAEFWADGPNSETPPGHWNVLVNYLADHPLLVKKIGGTGPVVDGLEWDVKMYFAINAALHDAACAAWSVKRSYDGWRPMSAVRYLSTLGQSSNPALPRYNAYGLPLITNLIELVTQASVSSGRHAGLTPGKIALLSWPGQPNDSVNNYSGVKFIHGDAWSTYQRTNFVTPPFPGYISGHSTFSRSAAELITGFTGSPYFPGGLGVYSNYTLGFEKGPSVPITLQWASYYDAADEAGISRIWGGIHPPIDNIAGRRVGAQVGKDVWAYVQKFFDGSVLPVLTCPGNISNECTGALVPVTYTVTAVDGLNNPLPVICVPPSGSGFRLGTSNVVCRATDSIGLSNTCSFIVAIVDTIAPQVSCSTNRVVDTTSSAGEVVTYTAGAADGCGIASFNCSPPSGSTFPVGTTTVTCRAVDGAGLTNSCDFTVTLKLIGPPTINCPPTVAAECTGTLTPATYTVTAVDYTGAPVPVPCTPPSGSGFRLGVSNVVCSATDSGGRSTNCTFNVTVVDTTPPQVTCSTNIVVAPTSANGAAVTYVASALDVGGIASFTCVPPSGSTFPVGPTTVTCRAVDNAGLANSCNFTVTVASANQTPVCAARVTCTFSLTDVSGSTQLISLDNANACVVLDGSQSSDPDGDALTFQWTVDGGSLSAGASVTNCLALGCHTVVLEVSDGQTSCRWETNLCVITACQAVEGLIGTLDASNLARKDKRPLIASLKSACAAFQEEHFVPALNQLEAFQNKVRAQIAPTYPGDAAVYTRFAQQIIDAITCAARLGLGEDGKPLGH